MAMPPRIRRGLTALLVVLALVAAVVVVRELRQAQSATAAQTIDRTRQVLPANRRPVFPVLDGTGLDGKPLSTAPLRGDVLVVNFWGSWCSPCRKEAAVLERVAQEDAARGVRFVGVDVRDSTTAGRAFETAHGITYPSFDDPAGLVALRLGALGPQATPSTYVVDRHGKLAAVFFGATVYDELHSAVELVLEKG